MENTGNNPYENKQNNNMFENEESSFDIMKWVRLVLQYWYLFVISLVAAYFLAYYSNRSWMPIYKTSARVIIEDRRGSATGAAAVMQGFNVQSGFSNINNQIIMFGSRDMSMRAVERLGLDVDYYTRGRFKTNNLYKKNPVEIKHDYLSSNAYSMEFKFESVDDSSFKISVEGNKKQDGFSITGKYGVPIKNSIFFITVNKTDFFTPKTEFYFRFRSQESWVSDFNPRLNFRFVMDRSSVVEVSLTGLVAERDKDFIDALCIEFLADNLERKNEAAIRTIEFIDSQLFGIADSLHAAESRLREFRTENKMVDVSAYGSNLMGQINNLDQRRVELNLKKTYLDYLSDYLKGNIEDGRIVIPSSLGITDGVLMTLVRELVDLQTKRDEMGVQSPHYRKYQSQIDAKKVALLEVLNNMYDNFNIELASFNKQYDVLMNRIATLPDKESQMVNYQRVFRIHDNYYTFLMQKRAEAQIQKASNSPDNIILGQATLGGVMNGGVKSKKYTQNLMIGLMLPVVFIFLRGFLDFTIKDKNDVKKYTRYDVIGTIQKGKYEQNPLLVKKQPKSIFAESFRLIRTRLEFIAKSHENKAASILVTSTESGDGKSFFSINLAGIYAMEKKKAILVDLDLRKPSIGQSLSLHRNKGVSNYLIGQVELEDIIIQKQGYDFDVILSGTIPPNPGELVKSEKLKELLEILKERYEYVIIDTSPIGLVGDAYALAHIVDTNIFVVRQEKTSKSFFKNVIEQLKQDNIPNVYIVMNGVDAQHTEYSTYHGYMKKSYYTKNKKANQYYNDYYEN